MLPPALADVQSYTGLSETIMMALRGELKELRADFGQRLDRIASDGKEVGERLSRIEGAQVNYLQELQGLREERKETDREVKALGERAQTLSNRIVRLETLIVPAAAFASAAASALIGHYLR